MGFQKSYSFLSREITSLVKLGIFREKVWNTESIGNSWVNNLVIYDSFSSGIENSVKLISSTNEFTSDNSLSAVFVANLA